MLAFAVGGVIVAWLTITLVFLGIGVSVQRVFRWETATFEHAVSACWVGWAVTLLYLEVWHLFRPVDALALVVPFIAGSAGLVQDILRHRALPAARRLKSPFVAAAIVGIIWLALLTQGPVGPYDAGLYHLQTIKWTNTYAVVPGLGNLQGRLAYNSAFFLYAALLNVGPLLEQAPELANSFVLLLLLVQLTWSTVRLVSRRGEAPARDYLCAILLLPTLALVGYQGLANTSPDLTVWALEIVLAVEILDLVLTPTAPTRFSALRRVLLACIGIAVKLSFLPFALACLIIVAWRQRDRIGDLASMAGVGAFVLVPWMAHGIMLSGYPLYPLAFMGLPVDWRIPTDAANLDAAWIAAWARAPGPDALQSLGTWSWVGSWFQRNSFELVPPLLLAVCALLAAIRVSRRMHLGLGTETLLLAPISVGLAAWFIEAPDPRFAGALPWMLGATLGLRVRCLAHPRARLNNVGLLTLVAVLPLQLLFLIPLVVLPVATLASDASPDAVPSPPMTTVTTRSGLVLNVPVEGDQTWNAALPSTPYPSDDLGQRCSATLACGFRVESSGS